MKKQVLLLGLCVLLLGYVSLAAAPRKHPEFTISNIARIRQAMSTGEIQAMFGLPDTISSQTVGTSA